MFGHRPLSAAVEQIALIETLVAKGGLRNPQAVYFDVKFPEYGALTGQKLTDKKKARDDVETDSDKHSPADLRYGFARAICQSHFALAQPMGRNFGLALNVGNEYEVFGRTI